MNTTVPVSPAPPTDQIERRRFLSSAAAALASGLGLFSCADASDRGAKPRITRISSYYLEAPRWKHIGRNAQLADHGWVARDTILRIETNAGVAGIGPSRATRDAAAQLIGRDPLEFFQAGNGLASPLGRGDAPLWDLIGKLLDTPVWKLLGAAGPEWVPVYDSSFYFSDLEPEYAGRGIARILDEVDHSLAQGHRALKLKIGRGYQWMEREAGFRRDVEVVQAVRRHAGPDIRLMVDANNGYDLPTTRRFLEEAGIEFYWVEEMFPEDVELDLSLKAWIQHKGWRSLVADGESVGDLGTYAPFIEARALDVLQSNIKGWGLQQLQKLSQMAAPAGIGLAPNNWESFFGFYMEIVLGRGIPNLLMAEQDPGKTDLVDVSGFEFKEGRCRAPDLPGCGWQVPLDGLERGARLNWRVD